MSQAISLSLRHSVEVHHKTSIHYVRNLRDQPFRMQNRHVAAPSGKTASQWLIHVGQFPTQ